MIESITVLDKNGENALPRAITALEKLEPRHANFGTVFPFSASLEETRNASELKKTKAPIAFCYASPNQEHEKPKFAKLKDAGFVFKGRIYALTKRDLLLERIIDRKKQNGDHIAEALLKKIEGDFFFIILKRESISAGRDPVGTEPLYYGENAKMAALASTKKALWQLGIEEAKSFPPGYLANINKDGFKFSPVRILHYHRPKDMTITAAAQDLQQMLERSVFKRINDLKKVAVAFSGGTDSSIIAAIAKKRQIEIHLVHVSLENHPETQTAIKAAEELGLPLHIALFKESDVATVLPEVVEIIEDPDPIKAAVGVPFYWAAQKTAKEGLQAMLAGQGADELFGGYQRYVDEYITNGEEKTRKTMFDDVTKLHESNIERDVKICNHHGIELRLPFASFQIAKFALTIPLELKIEKKKDSVRKLVLREVAHNLGLSQSIAQKEKKAVQYSTGTNDAIRKLARKQKMPVNEYIQRLFAQSKSNFNKSA